jgi:riboflavin synthase
MFTGIITDVGAVRSVERQPGVSRVRIASRYDAASIAIGASIACDGCCLTVTRVEADADGAVFDVDVSLESLARTTLGDWDPGRPVNLERAATLGQELGGHLVTGHVDGVAGIVGIAPDGASLRLEVLCPPPLARFAAPKGSIALDGISLTVNEVRDTADGALFTVNIIPHTKQATSWGQKLAGWGQNPRNARVNLEVDLIARYVERIMSQSREEAR